MPIAYRSVPGAVLAAVIAAGILLLAVPALAAPTVQRTDAFRKLSGEEIKRLFDDLRLSNYPDNGAGGASGNWSMTFNSNGQFDASEFSAGDNGYGTWRIEREKLCVTVGTIYHENFGGTPDPLSGCFDVFVDAKKGILAFGDPRKAGRLVVIETGIAGLISTLEPAPKPRMPAPEPAKPKPGKTLVAEAPTPNPAPEKPEPRNDALEKERLALERQRLAEETRLNEMRLKLERERVEQELALRRRKLEMQQQELILQQRQRGITGQRDLAAPQIRTAAVLETKTPSVTIQGEVRDDSPLVRVEINGEAVEFGYEDGRFTAEVPVALGPNKVRVAAYDVDGNRSQQIVLVTRTRDIPDVEFGDYRALVIGINDYESLPALKTAVQDARSVADTLQRKYGFDVRLMLNPSRDDIIDAFDELRDSLTERDNLLIYYAGHGWLDKQSGRGYWLPADAQADRRSRWLANSSLTDMLQATFAKHVMVVADSCYAGTLTRSIKVPERNDNFIAHMAEKRARVVLSSGGLEPVADSGAGGHSVFAAQFLKALDENEGVIDGTRLFEKLRHTVVLNARQTPEYSDIRFAGHEGGDFLFVRKD